MRSLYRSAAVVYLTVASIIGASSGAARADSRLLWAQGDWPGCGGVCALELEEEAVILEIVPALAPDSGVQLTLTVWLKTFTSGDGTATFDVSRSRGQSDTGAVVLDEDDVAGIPGGTANIASAVLTWREPSADAEGKECFEIDP